MRKHFIVYINYASNALYLKFSSNFKINFIIEMLCIAYKNVGLVQTLTVINCLKLKKLFICATFYLFLL